jgi:pumilio homology domain family member 6
VLLRCLDLLAEVKTLWETARSSQSTAEKRSSCITQMDELLRDKLSDLVLKHDAARVVQTMMKHGSTVVREHVVDELQSHTVDLAMSQYGRFLLQAMFRYGGRVQRARLIQRLQGRIPRLSKHAEGAKAVDFIYQEITNPREQQAMLAEFYGAEYALFSKLHLPSMQQGSGVELSTASTSSPSASSKRKRGVPASAEEKSEKKAQAEENGPNNSSVTGVSLGEILRERPAKGAQILQRLNAVLQQASEKGTLVLNYMHPIYNDYLQHASSRLGANRKEDIALLENLVNTTAEQLLHVCHTRPGSFAAVRALGLQNARDRKSFLKSMKGFSVKTAQDNNGYRLMCAAFSWIDDTVLLRKSCTNELVDHMDEVVCDPFARIVMLQVGVCVICRGVCVCACVCVYALARL